MHELTDEDLLRRWSEHRDADAFAELTHRHAATVVATCRRILGDAVEAEDVAQDCFLRLAMRPCTAANHFIAWLHKLATHRSLDRLRQTKRRRAREERFFQEAASATDSNWNELEPFVDEAIAELPDDLRALVLAHFMQRMSYADLGERFGLSRSTAARKVKSAVDRIRDTLDRRGLNVKGAMFLSELALQNTPPISEALTGSLAKMAISGGMRSALLTSTTIGGFVVAKKLAVVCAVAMGLAGLIIVARQWDGSQDVRTVAAAKPPIGTQAPEPVRPEFGKTNIPAPAKRQKKVTFRPMEKDLLAALLKLRASDNGKNLKAITSNDLPADNGAHYFLLATELLPEFDSEWLAKLLEEFKTTGWRDDPKLRALLEQCKPALDALRAGLDTGNAMLPPPRGPEEPLPYLAKYRDLSRIMALEAMGYSEAGDNAAALNVYSEILAFGNESARGATIIGLLVGRTAPQIVGDNLSSTLRNGNASPEELIAFAASLNGYPSHQTAMMESMQLESHYLNEWAQTSFPGGKGFQDFLTQDQSGWDPATIRALQQATPEQLSALMASAMADYDSYAQYMEVPYYTLREMDLSELQSDNPLTQALVPSILDLARNVARSTAVMDSIEIVSAVEAYAGEHGSYPQTLDALTPRYLANVPTDPFSGQPFHYASGDGNFTLYSAGADSVDNGGSNAEWNANGGDLILHH